MTRFGLDSTSQVPVAAHHAVGSTVALRYLSRSTGKVITRSEHDAYRKAGIDLVLVFEDSGRPDQRGYDGGKADAEFAVNQAHDILGKPTLPLCIRYAADFDLDPSSTDAYYDGVAAVMPRACCGPYGSDRVVAHQAARGFQTLWQTYAWSGGRFFSSPHNSAYQYSNGHTVGGVGVDYNHLYGHDFGQLDRSAPKPPAAHPNLHHDWFYTGPFDCAGRKLSERALVVEYDRLRPHWALHHHRLVAIRSDLKLLAQRLYTVVQAEASAGLFVLPYNWNAFRRGWRYKQLLARSQGKRFL